MSSDALYTRYNSRRSKKPAGSKTIKLRSIIADKPGKYQHFTGYVQWGETNATAVDASFFLYTANKVKIISIIDGRWADTLHRPEIAGGEYHGITITEGEIYGGTIITGKVESTYIFGGEILPEVTQTGCSRNEKPDPWQPKTAKAWVKWFNDDKLLEEWYAMLY